MLKIFDLIYDEMTWKNFWKADCWSRGLLYSFPGSWQFNSICSDQSKNKILLTELLMNYNRWNVVDWATRLLKPINSKIQIAFHLWFLLSRLKLSANDQDHWIKRSFIFYQIFFLGSGFGIFFLIHIFCSRSYHH